MARKPKSKSKTSVNVNFKGVESRRTPPEGDYKCAVLEATSGTSGAGNDQIEFIAEISAGEFKGQKLYLYCPLQENSLWKLHAFLTALGVEVPEDDMDIDLSELVGEEFMGVITHETYNGRKRSKLTDFDSIDSYTGDDDEDDKKGKKGKKKSKSDDDDEDDEPKKKKGKSKKSDDDEDEDDEPKKKGKKSKSKKDDEDDEDDEPKKGKKSKGKSKSDDDEDEDDEPKKKGKKSKSKKKTYDRDEVEDMDEEELEELLEEAGLDDEVDLDDYKKLPKKVAAVIEALEEAELLDD